MVLLWKKIGIKKLVTNIDTPLHKNSTNIFLVCLENWYQLVLVKQLHKKYHKN